MGCMIYLNLFLKDDNYDAKEMENLKSLVSSLRQLLDLHRKYNCRLSLSIFEKVCLLLVTQSVQKHVWLCLYLCGSSFIMKMTYL